jgi:hypothetical protein
MTCKILILDIETAPALADVWGLWKQNVSLDMLRKSGYIMSYSAKWLGEDKIYYKDCRRKLQEDEKWVVKGLLELLDEADIVVAHNGDKFDLPWIRGRALYHKLDIPSPYKQVDTLKTARLEFRLLSNKLEYLANLLSVRLKEKHLLFPGHELWSECVQGNEEAWEEMEKYNIQDIITLEDVYLRLRPYMRNHPNVGVYLEEDHTVCPKCGSSNIHWRGYYYTDVGKYHRFQCQEENCGGWGRSRCLVNDKDKRKVLGVNAR